MIYIRDLFKKNRGKLIPVLSPDQSVYKAVKEMIQLDIEAYLIADENKVLGIFSENDYLNKLFLEGKDSKQTSVKEVMTKDIFYVGINKSLDECMNIMIAENIHHLPVNDGSTVVGFITIKDVIDAILEDRDLLIEQLFGYITGSQFNQRPEEYSYDPNNLIDSNASIGKKKKIHKLRSVDV
jgi:CBS domain-containing protein